MPLVKGHQPIVAEATSIHHPPGTPQTDQDPCMTMQPKPRASFSIHRALVQDLCYFAQKMPLYALDRTFDLGEVALLRKRAPQRISWSLLFIKAYAMATDEFPLLRQTYRRWPWPHFSLHASNIAMLAINRAVDGEDRICWGRFIAPETQPLEQLQNQLDQYQAQPVQDAFRRQLRFSRVPTLLRRVGWWLTLNGPAEKRAKRLGTFGLSTMAGQGGSSALHPSCLTTSLSYGPLDPQGRMTVSIVFDHRVFDGAPLARAMTRLEQILQGPISAELDQLSRVPQAA